MSKALIPSPLTIDQFIHLLGETPRKWVLKTHNRLRFDGRTLHGRIPACPIEVVAGKAGAYGRTGAGFQLGLSGEDTVSIVQASDGGERDSNHVLRARLIEACGIGAGAQ